MRPLTVTILAVRPAVTGEKYLGVNVKYGVAAISTWLAEGATPGPVLIVKERRRKHSSSQEVK